MNKKSSITWITGYQGFIGSNLISSFIQDSDLIGCIGRGDSEKNDSLICSKIKIVDGDINIENLIKLLKKTSEPNIIFHLGTCSSIAKAEENIVKTSTENIYSISSILEFCRNYSKKTLLVVLSSPALFGDNKKVVNMKSDEKPNSIYGLQKSFIEQICNYYTNKYFLKIKIARVYSCYGNGLKKQVLWDFCNKYFSSKEIILQGTGRESRDFIHINDLIQSLRLFINCDDNLRLIDIGNGKKIKIIKLINLISWYLGDQQNKTLTKYKFSGKVSKFDPLHLIANNEKLLNLGYKQTVSLETGVKEYCEWFLKIKN